MQLCQNREDFRKRYLSLHCCCCFFLSIWLNSFKLRDLIVPFLQHLKISSFFKVWAGGDEQGAFIFARDVAPSLLRLQNSGSGKRSSCARLHKVDHKQGHIEVCCCGPLLADFMAHKNNWEFLPLKVNLHSRTSKSVDFFFAMSVVFIILVSAFFFSAGWK